MVFPLHNACSTCCRCRVTKSTRLKCFGAALPQRQKKPCNPPECPHQCALLRCHSSQGWCNGLQHESHTNVVEVQRNLALVAHHDTQGAREQQHVKQRLQTTPNGETDSKSGDRGGVMTAFFQACAHVLVTHKNLNCAYQAVAREAACLCTTPCTLTPLRLKSRRLTAPAGSPAALGDRALAVNVRKTALKHPCKGIQQYITPKGKPSRSCSGVLCQACLTNPHPISAACMCPTHLLPCILAC